MPESLFSPSWYRVARLRPRVRSHAAFHRHRYRGRLWYVLQDHSTGRSHRLTPAAYHLVGLMNGQRTTQEIWEAANTLLGDDGPTQDETINLLGLLHLADVLQCDTSPDTLELMRRRQHREQVEWWRRFTNPLAVRVPLLDPDRFLERGLPWVRPLFSWPVAVAACAVVLSAVLATGIHWRELTEGSVLTLLQPRNLVLLGIAYPLLKGLHELAHAFATKVWGGEVHEMGILFLVLFPIPYVDASSASVFPDKWKRAAVCASGIAVELLVASLALFVWIVTEPGAIRTVAYDVAWIGGVSTLLFNGNPLLRFDGYYVLADVIEIPNLGPRSNQYFAFLVLRRLFGLERVRNPVTAPGEVTWFVAYGMASFLYRLAVLFAIALFLAGRFFMLGVGLALFAVAFQVVVPVLRKVAFLATSPRIAGRRLRAIATSGALLLGAAALLLGFPLPSFTRAEGVVWPPEGAEVRAGSDGFVLRLAAQPGAHVEPDAPLVVTREPSLEARVKVLEAHVAELRARFHAERVGDQVRAQITREELESVAAELARARERAGDVILRSPALGAFVLPHADDLVGRFVRQGELIGYVVGDSVTTARVVVPHTDVAQVRERTEDIQVRLSRRVGRVFPARVRREVPGATHRLPSAALGRSGGGTLPVDPADPDGLRTLDPVFQLDLTLPPAAAVKEIGGRVYVRFDHGSESAGVQAWRAIRRLFLRRLGV